MEELTDCKRKSFAANTGHTLRSHWSLRSRLAALFVVVGQRFLETSIFETNVIFHASVLKNVPTERWANHHGERIAKTETAAIGNRTVDTDGTEQRKAWVQSRFATPICALCARACISRLGKLDGASLSSRPLGYPTAVGAAQWSARRCPIAPIFCPSI